MSNKKDHDKLATRLVHILTMFNDGMRLYINELAKEFGVDIRTIQRDFNKFSTLMSAVHS